MENEVLKAIKERRSIRRFKADQITDEELKTFLHWLWRGIWDMPNWWKLHVCLLRQVVLRLRFWALLF